MNPELLQRAEHSQHMAADAGYSWLNCQLFFERDSQPACDFRTSPQLAEAIAKRTGRYPLPTSIRRCHGVQRANGHLQSNRVMPRNKPRGAMFVSPSGTTEKETIWSAFGRKDVLSKRRRRKLATEQRAHSKHPGVRRRHEIICRQLEEGRQRLDDQRIHDVAAVAGPRFVAAGVACTVQGELVTHYEARSLSREAADRAMFEAMAAPAIAAAASRELAEQEAHDAAVLESTQRVRGPP